MACRQISARHCYVDTALHPVRLDFRLYACFSFSVILINYAKGVLRGAVYSADPIDDIGCLALSGD